MSELKCPFCNGELVGTIGHPICRNEKCEMCDEMMPQELLDLLDRTRKALEIAVDALKKSHDFYSKAFYDPELSEKWFVVCQVIIGDYVNEALEEIETALEQKDEK